MADRLARAQHLSGRRHSVEPEVLPDTAAGVDRARHLLEAGAFVCIPTYRWFLVVARGDRSDLAEAIYRAKRRPLTERLLCLVRDLDHARELCPLDHVTADPSDPWPPGLAIRDRKRVPFGSKPGVDPRHALLGRPSNAAAALAAASTLLVSTSINCSGDWPPTTVDEVLAVIRAMELPVAAILDGPPVTQPRTPMTIVSCLGSAPAIERAGAISEQDLRRTGWL